MVPWNQRPPQEGSIEPSRRFHRTPKKVLSNPKRFYRTPFWAPKSSIETLVGGTSEPQTGFHRTFRIEPPFLGYPFIWRAGTTPILEKTLRECRGKWKSFNWVPTISGNRSESCSENCGFRIAQVVRRHSENGISNSENCFLNSESCSENTPELSQSSENGLFALRAFFLKLGWFPGPRLLILKFSLHPRLCLRPARDICSSQMWGFGRHFSKISSVIFRALIYWKNLKGTLPKGTSRKWNFK